MRKSKKANVAVAQSEPTTPREFIDGEGFLALQGETYWKWRALDAGRANAEATLEKRRVEFEQMIASTPALVAKREEVQHAFTTLSQARKDLEELQVSIGGKIGVDLKSCAIDDITGRLHVLSTSAPMTAEKPRKPRKI
jgi:hypothetical protein